MDFEQADIKITIFFGVDNREQSCRPSSAELPTIVSSGVDHRRQCCRPSSAPRKAWLEIIG